MHLGVEATTRKFDSFENQKPSAIPQIPALAKICVPVCVRHPDEMRDAIAAATRVGDIVELRADCLVDPRATVSFLHESARAIERPLIVTMRSPEQGGRAEIDYQTRRQFWLALDHSNAGFFIDLELDMVQDFAGLESAKLPVDWSRVICSHHDFARVPGRSRKNI